MLDSLTLERKQMEEAGHKDGLATVPLKLK
jgi:hypothetical protein